MKLHQATHYCHITRVPQPRPLQRIHIRMQPWQDVMTRDRSFRLRSTVITTGYCTVCHLRPTSISPRFLYCRRSARPPTLDHSFLDLPLSTSRLSQRSSLPASVVIICTHQPTSSIGVPVRAPTAQEHVLGATQRLQSARHYRTKSTTSAPRRHLKKFVSRHAPRAFQPHSKTFDKTPVASPFYVCLLPPFRTPTLYCYFTLNTKPITSSSQDLYGF